MPRVLVAGLLTVGLVSAGCSSNKTATSSPRQSPVTSTTPTHYGDNASLLLARVPGCPQPKDTTTGAETAVGVASSASCPIPAGGTIDLLTYSSSAAQTTQDNSLLAAATDEMYYATGTGWTAMADDTDVFTEQTVAKALVRAIGGRVAHQAAPPS